MTTSNLELHFQREGNLITKHTGPWNEIGLTRFRKFFGVTPAICRLLWTLLLEYHEESQPKHLLYALLFLKLYQEDFISTALCNGEEESIFRVHAWKYVFLIANYLPKVIDFDQRTLGAPNNTHLFVTLKTIDCPIERPVESGRHRYFSSRINGPAVRYEVGLSLRTGHIVWVYGGYPCGEVDDLSLAKKCYVKALQEGEKTMAGNTYTDSSYFIVPKSHPRLSDQFQTAEELHGTIQNAFRQWAVLKNPFRHFVGYHRHCFYAVAKLIQIMINEEENITDPELHDSDVQSR